MNNEMEKYIIEQNTFSSKNTTMKMFTNFWFDEDLTEMNFLNAFSKFGLKPYIESNNSVFEIDCLNLSLLNTFGYYIPIEKMKTPFKFPTMITLNSKRFFFTEEIFKKMKIEIGTPLLFMLSLDMFVEKYSSEPTLNSTICRLQNSTISNTMHRFSESGYFLYFFELAKLANINLVFIFKMKKYTFYFENTIPIYILLSYSNKTKTWNYDFDTFKEPYFNVQKYPCSLFNFKNLIFV